MNGSRRMGTLGASWTSRAFVGRCVPRTPPILGGFVVAAASDTPPALTGPAQDLVLAHLALVDADIRAPEAGGDRAPFKASTAASGPSPGRSGRRRRRSMSCGSARAC